MPGYWAYTGSSELRRERVGPEPLRLQRGWIEGHYEPRAYTWGYCQPYWVAGALGALLARADRETTRSAVIQL